MRQLIDYDKLRSAVVSGLKKYLKCPVIRSNQNAEPPPYPYVSYTITTLMSANNGTYGEYSDGKSRKPFTQTWSISALSDENSESVSLAIKAREWLDRVGTIYLNDNDVIVQSIGSVTNRDNVLTVEYEYKNGFDVVFWLLDTVQTDTEEVIENLEFGDYYHGKRLEARLDGVEYTEYGLSQASKKDAETAADFLGDRLSGV